LLLLRVQDALSAISGRNARPGGRRLMRMLSAPEVAPEVLEAMGVPAITEEQWAAISMPLEPFVLVAGAGSGKTSVMAARVVYLALAALGRIDAPGVLPGNALCLTFTNKATRSEERRVGKEGRSRWG